MNNKGLTLIELLLYIGLFAILSLLIGRQFKALVGNYVTGKNVSRQQTDSRDVFGLMVREIRNMGLKTSFSGTTTITKTIRPGIAVDATDLSSFNHTEQNGTNYDTLEFFKIDLNSSGSYDNTDTIKYYMNGTTLRRDLKSSEAPTHTNSIVAENVMALQFRYGVLTTNDSLVKEIPLASPSTSTWSSSGTTPDYLTSSIRIAPTAAATGYLKYETALTINANSKYSVSLRIDPSGGFPANITWLQISFQNSGRTTVYGSEKFKPFTPGATMAINVPVNTGSATSISAYAYIDYSTSGAGILTFKGMVVRCTELGAYDWKDNPTVAEKANVRAIRMYVLTRTQDNAKSGNLGSITVGTLPPIARSGDYTWRLFTETIETPNNGVF